MKAPEFELPPREARLNARAVRLEWWTIGLMLSVAVVMYLAMGTSQAMKAAWVEDVLSLVPPAAFLVASRYRGRPPSEDFPYGHHRSISIAFLCGALALFALGAYMVQDSATKLLLAEHASIGTLVVLGHPTWLGWWMIGALAYSAVPPFLLGRAKLPLAAALRDKALHADADMNAADWRTALAGIVGVLGIGIGWWWLDAVAALAISGAILADGWKNLRRVVAELMDRRPTTVDGEEEPAPRRLLARVRELDWVEDAAIRVRDAGHVVTGEIYVVPRRGTRDLVARLQRVGELASESDWRLHDVVVVPVADVDPRGAPRGGTKATNAGGESARAGRPARRRAPR